MSSFKSKQPYEAFYVDFNFSNVMNHTDSILSAVVTAKDPDNIDVTETFLDPIRQHIDTFKVYIWVRAGTSGKIYTITCKVITVAGEKYEAEGTITVTEI